MILQILPPGPNLTKKVDCTYFFRFCTLFTKSRHMSLARDLLLITLSIPLSNSTWYYFIGWPFYNSKSSIPNGSASPLRRITFRSLSFTIASGSHATRRSPRIITSVDPVGELDKLAGAQGTARRSNARSKKAPIPLKALIASLVPPPAKDLFTKFMKVFMETT